MNDATNATTKPVHTMSNDDLCAIMRARGVIRGRAFLTMPGMSLVLSNVRSGKGGPADGTAVSALWDEARLDREENCSDERAQILDALLTAAWREGLREGVGA